MSSDSAALWAALGDPCADALLPPARSSAWAGARRSLSSCLRSHGTPWRVRSPAALWAMLRGGPLPAACTWRDLLREDGLGELLATIRSARSNRGWKFASWNPQWLLSPHTDQAAAKRAAIRRWLAAGKVVLLQETHWREYDIAIWEHAIPGSTVVAFPAAEGPQGGPSGGVAVRMDAV